MKLSFLSTLLFLFFYSSFYAKTCSSVVTGNWGNGGTWSCNPAGAPACGDVIIIEAGHTVTISNNYQWHNGGCAGSPSTIIIKGTLHFSGGGKLQLATDSDIIIEPGGSVTADNYSGNNNLMSIGNQEVWNAGDEGGPVTGPWQNGNSTLPITLRSFYGFQENSIIQLYWSTASEINNHYFSIERSEDGENWNSIGIHNGGNNSNTELYYGFTDNNPLKGRSFYRLVQTDYDGESESFEPIYINFIELATFTLFPNPSNEIITISFNDNFKFNEVIIYDACGKIILSLDIDDKSIFSLDVSSYSNGIYFVSCKGDALITTQKLVVE